jgi:hypothetical protein
MARHIVCIAIATLVALSTIVPADAAPKGTHAKKGHASLGTIVFTKHYDKASPYLG